MTTLDDLKRAVAKVAQYKALPLLEQLSNGVGFAAAERDAWRTAFEWRHAIDKRDERVDANLRKHDDGAAVEWLSVQSELDEGMALIREKLS